jgi:hypothetical protein
MYGILMRRTADRIEKACPMAGENGACSRNMALTARNIVLAARETRPWRRARHFQGRRMAAD